MKRLLILAVVGFVLTACKHVEYVVVPEHHTDTLIVTKQQRDSIWLHDSVLVREKGDTLLIEKWHTKYVEKQVHDTCYQSRTDSIPVPYPVTEYVEKQLTRWQQAKMNLGLVFMGVLGLLGVMGVMKLKKKIL